MDEPFKIINDNCLNAMGSIGNGTIDAIVTDPPYGLAFMGAEWDSFNGRNGRQTTNERQDEGRRYAKENKGAPRYGNSHGKRVTRDEMVSFQESMTPIFEEMLRVAKSGAHLLCFGGTRTFHRLVCSLEDAGWEIRDTIMWVYGSGFPKSMDVGKKLPEWKGWGTCLKPSWEPIIVARKPLDGTVAHNVMTHGTGAINIDGCRVGTETMVNRPAGNKAGGNSLNMSKYGMPQDAEPTTATGRFPANLVHDGSQEVLKLFPNDSGRFFYCAKASKKDRGEGNDHPTVKPNALMRWLVRLVTPEGGVVLDPFMGSGSTGVAATQEGFGFIGIDMDEHYCDIARKRISNEPLAVI